MAPPWEALKIPDFRKAYIATLRSNRKKLPVWIEKLEIASRPGIPFSDGVTVAFYYSGNKIQEGGKQIVIVFEPSSRQIAIKIDDEGIVQYLGRPTPFMRELLDR